MSNDLAGRVAFVTGGSRGIGAAVGRRFATDGAHVALVSRTGGDLGLPGAIGITADVRSADEMEAAVAETVERFGGIDILVANAGVASYGPLLDISNDEIDEMIDVNVKGTLHAARAALPYLLRSDAADIVSLASEAGRRGLPNETVYCASKFAQVGFTRALDHELREHGIRCTNLCPGGVATGFGFGRGREPEDEVGMMSAEDVAEFVAFVVTRPRGLRILEAALRPMKEASWG